MHYSPCIKYELVERLYQLKQKVGLPITTLANKAIEEYLNRQEQENPITHKGGDDNERSQAIEPG